MAVSLIGSAGVFTRIGQLLGGINEVNGFVNTTEGTRLTNILAQYLTNEQGTVAGVTNDLTSYRGSGSSWLSSLRAYAQQTVIAQVNRDTPLNSLDLATALKVLISQMATSADTLTRPTVTVMATANGGNYGNTVLATSLKDTDGQLKYTPFPDTLTVTATSDAGRGAAAYAEPFSVVSLPSVDSLNFLWPQGSGVSGSLSTVNAANDTLVADGSFEQWTGTTALNKWTILTGTGGTTVTQSTAALRGSYALRFVGASELTSIYQTLNTGALQPNTVYCLNFWAKRSVSLAAGVLRVRLTDGSGVTLVDDAATACSFNTTLSSGFTTSYAAYNTYFVTPKVLPATYRVSIDLSTAITTGETIDIDLMGLVSTTPLYAGGPTLVTFSGGTQAAINDKFNVAVANNGGTTSLLMGCERLFNLRSLGIKLPSGTSGTVSNTLIS